MRKNTCTFLRKTAPVGKTLIDLFVLALAGQMAFAGAAAKTSFSPSPSRFLDRLNLPMSPKAEPQSPISRAEQPKVNANGNSSTTRRTTGKVVVHPKFLSTPKTVKSRKGKLNDCKDGCLVESLACVAIAMLGGCPPCAAICLGYEVYCIEHCPGSIE
jgi:hypothetical protein